ncbi:MAG TPA: hypothetical protein VFA26_05295 [Gemmataceae bacterium]|nr:hypothetical protein [Gemmataceae bacterium]
MLLPSERHRPEDLALWAELEEADHIHGRRLLRSGKVERSVAALRAFASAGPCHLCLSGGKDSTALAGLAALAGLSLPAVWFRAVPEQSPDVPAVLDALGLPYEVVDYDAPVPLSMTRLEAETVATRNFLAACRRCQKALGRRVLGVRADESRARLIKMRRWGLMTASSCTPLGWWTRADVFGFLAVRGLPVHPAYAMLGGGRWRREDLRIDALMGERGDGRGRAEWERTYYGDVLDRLLAAEAAKPRPET